MYTYWKNCFTVVPLPHINLISHNLLASKKTTQMYRREGNYMKRSNHTQNGRQYSFTLR